MALALAVAAFTTTTDAAISNEVTDWVKATQKTVADLSIPNQLSGRYYALVSLAQYKALDAYANRTTSNSTTASNSGTSSSSAAGVTVNSTSSSSNVTLPGLSSPPNATSNVTVEVAVQGEPGTGCWLLLP